MCTVSINIDEATMQRIDPHLTSRESIGHWLQHQVDLMLEGMTHGMTIEEFYADMEQDVMAEALKKDMTPEQLYSLISEEIDDIYANG